MLPCSKRFCHDWTVCPYSHPGEKAKRRDPRLYSYTGIACPNMKKVLDHYSLLHHVGLTLQLHVLPDGLSSRLGSQNGGFSAASADHLAMAGS